MPAAPDTAAIVLDTFGKLHERGEAGRVTVLREIGNAPLGVNWLGRRAGRKIRARPCQQNIRSASDVPNRGSPAPQLEGKKCGTGPAPAPLGGRVDNLCDAD